MNKHNKVILKQTKIKMKNINLNKNKNKQKEILNMNK